MEEKKDNKTGSLGNKDNDLSPTTSNSCDCDNTYYYHLEEKFINKKPAITFSDILIEPNYSEITSRKNVDISSKLHDKIRLVLPVFSSNMKTVTGIKMAKTMFLNGGLGIQHRFCSIEKAVQDFKSVFEHFDKDSYCTAVSIGVKDEDKNRFEKLWDASARIFCIDVAHGHSLNFKNMAKWILNQNLKDIIIIGGNIATSWASKDLQQWGINIQKVGIGASPVCQTRTQTSVGVPQLQALINIRQDSDENIKLISDGGIKTVGDIVKCMVFADAVCVGSFISGTTETPGDVYKNEQGQFYKTYGGSASKEHKIQGGQEGEFVEGSVKMVPFRGHVKYLLKEISDGLKSAFSYVGASNLKEFKEYARLIEISSGSKSESKF